MQDNDKGLRNKAPMAPSQRVVTLSPILEAMHGPQYDYNDALAGEVPKDNLGFFPQGTSEVDDEVFHKDFPESTDRATNMWKGGK